ncbi:MAG: phosphoglycerate dehydrogenase [Chloroflexi bacterium]|nr:phosphoglycerate dehydrogenase [Chloroflexota bacterium]
MTCKVLVTEALAAEGLALLGRCAEVTVRPNPTREELLGLVGEYDALVVRSATRVSAEVLAAGKRLRVVGRAGTGVDNIDLEAATRRGVMVVNAPGGNTIAVAEHTLALMLNLARHVCRADSSTHAGRWEKKDLMGSELRGKTLGLVGLGRVGAAVASRAHAFEMRLLAYDPFVSVERAAQLDVRMATLDEVLAQADYVSLHVPATERTRGMIGARELALMKPGARLINCARGDLVVEADLVEALTRGQLAGAALDVYPDEPRVSQALRDCTRALLTPHLGASTEEAQTEASVEVAEQVADVLCGRAPRHPVNTVALSAEEQAFLQPYVDLAQRMGRLYAQVAENNLSSLQITLAGEVVGHDSALLSAAALAGVLSVASTEPVNLVNAPLLARERGLAVQEVRTSEAQDWAGLVTLRATTTSGEHVLSGTVMRGRPHIVRIEDYWLDLIPEGLLLVSEHIEQPGVLGRMGTLLGDAGINISFVQVGRRERGGVGLMVVGIDDVLPDGVLRQVLAMPSVRSARLVRL